MRAMRRLERRQTKSREGRGASKERRPANMSARRAQLQLASYTPGCRITLITLSCPASPHTASVPACRRVLCLPARLPRSRPSCASDERLCSSSRRPSQQVRAGGRWRLGPPPPVLPNQPQDCDEQKNALPCACACQRHAASLRPPPLDLPPCRLRRSLQPAVQAAAAACRHAAHLWQQEAGAAGAHDGAGGGQAQHAGRHVRGCETVVHLPAPAVLLPSAYTNCSLPFPHTAHPQPGREDPQAGRAAGAAQAAHQEHARARAGGGQAPRARGAQAEAAVREPARPALQPAVQRGADHVCHDQHAGHGAHGAGDAGGGQGDEELHEGAWAAGWRG